jgi:hypothetical protein
MVIKIFEIRSPATLIVVMAIKLSAANEAERYLLSRSGYGRSNKDYETYIMLQRIDMDTNCATTDPYKQDIYELREAHLFIKKNFDILKNGAVIDIEYITGKTSKPKDAERLDFILQMWNMIE